MDGSDTPEEFSKWEEAVEDAIEEAQLQGCWSKLALWQRRSGDGGPEGSGKGLAKIRRRSDGGPAKVWRRSGRGLAEAVAPVAMTEVEATTTKKKSGGPITHRSLDRNQALIPC